MKGADECPRCGSGNVASLDRHTKVEHPMAGCVECLTLWEPFDPAALVDWDHDDQNRPFAKPCDNCAFRQGSPEREDTVKWELLIQNILLAECGAFFCHKGVPLELNVPGQSHDHPKFPDGNFDYGRSRMCAGFIAWNRGANAAVNRKIRKMMEEA